RQPFRGFAAEAARCAGDENSLGHGLPPVMRVRGQCEMISRYGWSGTGGVPRPGCPRASLNRRRERRVGGDEALDASQKAIPGWRVQPTFLKTQTKRGFP